jgi:hypothetical protein
MSKVLLHVPCDGCGVVSYCEFYTIDNGLSRQRTVRAVDNLVLCEVCEWEYYNLTDDGLCQMDMFEDEH